MTDYEVFAQLLQYEPDSGDLQWKTFRGSRASAGKIASSKKGNGYLQVEVSGKNYLVHRVAWLLTHGEWPEFVDHIDGDRSNNRLINLRNATKAINAQNQRRARSDNRSTGLLGVSNARGGKFRATIQAYGVQRQLGVFSTPEEAHHAYLSAKREHHAGCTI